MDFWNAMRELRLERDRIDTLIAVLESVQRGSQRETRSRRGRKHMPDDERKLVSERMRAYWERRRSGGRQSSVASA